MNLDDVLARTPTLPETDDQRVKFYLENRQIIETWAALRREAAAAISESLLDLVEPLKDDFEQLGERDIQVGVVGSRNQHIAITRLGWERADSGSPVQVSLETESQVIRPGGAILVFPCVRARQSHPLAPQYRDGLAALSTPLKASLGRQWKSSPPEFVIWKYIDDLGESGSLAGVVETARADVLRLWTVAAPSIDALMNEAGGAV